MCDRILTKPRKVDVDAAALDLRRQRQLLAQGSARKFDVARTEEKLATLQRAETNPLRSRIKAGKED